MVSAASQYVSEGKVDWEIVLVDMAFGAVGGAVSATGISLGASIAANATLSAATYITEQSVLEEEITGTGLFASTIGGAVSGLAGGRGADAEGLGKELEGESFANSGEQIQNMRRSRSQNILLSELLLKKQLLFQ